MDIQLGAVFRQRIEKIDTLGQVGENLTAGLHQRRNGVQVDCRIRDRSAQPRLGLCVERLGRELLHILGVHPAQLLNVKYGGTFGNAGDVKDLCKLVQCKEFLLGKLAARRPAQKRHIIEYRFGQIALLDQVLIAGIAVALGHFMLRVAHDRRAVDIRRNLPAERLIQQIVLRRGGKILAPAHDVRDAHEMIVDDVCKVVGGQAVGFEQNLILHFLILDGDIAEGRVVERGASLVWDALADDIRLAGGGARLRLAQRQVAAGTDVLFDLLRLAAGIRLLVLVALLAEAVVRAALFDQKLGVPAEQTAPLGLDIRADRTADVGTLVVGQAALGHCPVDHIDRTLDQTALIGVLDAQDERAAVAARDEPCIKRRAQIADVHVARGTWRKACAHPALRDSGFHFLKKTHDWVILRFCTPQGVISDIYNIFSLAHSQCFLAKSVCMC